MTEDEVIDRIKHDMKVIHAGLDGLSRRDLMLIRNSAEARDTLVRSPNLQRGLRKRYEETLAKKTSKKHWSPLTSGALGVAAVLVLYAIMWIIMLSITP